MWLFLDVDKKNFLFPPPCSIFCFTPYDFFFIMSVLPPSGSHLSVMDTQDTAVASLDTLFTKVASVKYYGGIVITVTADVEFSIVVEWSSDGIVFVPDLDRVITHDGNVLVDGFYERDVLGEFVKLIITNTDVGDGDLFVHSYAKIRATGNYDNGLNIDTPNPPFPDVWWERTGAPASSFTILKASGQSIATAPGAIDIVNVPDTALDQPTNNTLFGTLRLDFDNKQAADARTRAFNGVLASGNDSVDGGMIIRGPGCGRLVVFNSRSSVIECTTASPQSSIVAHNSTFTNLSESSIQNPRYESYQNIYDSEIHKTDDGSGSYVVGQNFYNNIWLSKISDEATTTTGIDENYNTYLRFYRSRHYADDSIANLWCGTRINAGSNPGGVHKGICVLTDHAIDTNPQISNWLNVDTGIGSNEFFCRFNQGYRFYTDSNSNIGATITPGGTTWNPICDERTKQDLVEYEDSAGVLERVSGLTICNYKCKGTMESEDAEEVESEQSRFRISPTAQAFHYVFHPEEGDTETIIEADRLAAKERLYKRCRKECTEKSGKEELSPKEEDDFHTSFAAQLQTPETQELCEKMSIRSLNMEEMNAALLLCIKELKIQLDDVKTRLDQLEK